MWIAAADLDAKHAYFLMTSVVVPRPIAWVSTMSSGGVLNAAPFSYFQALSSAPPMLMISVGRRPDGAPKDTRANIEATGEFVVNVVSEASASRMVRTAGAFDAEVSEFDAVGIEPAPSRMVKPPRIAESLVSMECRLDRVIEIGRSGVIFGEILCFHLDDKVVTADRTADARHLLPLGRLGGRQYSPLREVVEIDADGAVSTARSETLSLWGRLRDDTIDMASRLSPEHLERRLGDDGMTVGRMLRHLAGCTRVLLLRLLGREDEGGDKGGDGDAGEIGGENADGIGAWDPSWTPDRIVAELTADKAAFLEGLPAFLPGERPALFAMIRHEAWHQGQIAALLRGCFEDEVLWRGSDPGVGRGTRPTDRSARR